MAAAQKYVKIIIEKIGSSFDLESFSVQLIRLDDMDHLDLTVARENRRIESALCTISGKTLGKESVLTTLAPKKPVALSVSSINIDSMEDKNNNSSYKKHDSTNEEVSFCEQVESNILSPTIDDTDRK